MNKKDSIKKYLNAFLNKKWTIIHDPESGSDWIIDVKNKFWIIELGKWNDCRFRWQVFEEISELYDMDLAKVIPVMRNWVKEIFKRKVKRTFSLNGSYTNKVENVLNHRVKK